MVQQRVRRVAAVAQGAGFSRAHLQAVGFGGPATRVGGWRLPPKSCILENGHATLGTSLGVVAGVHGSCGRAKEEDKSQRTKQPLCHDGSGKNLCDVLFAQSQPLKLSPPPPSQRMGKNNFPVAGSFSLSLSLPFTSILWTESGMALFDQNLSFSGTNKLLQKEGFVLAGWKSRETHTFSTFFAQKGGRGNGGTQARGMHKLSPREDLGKLAPEG